MLSIGKLGKGQERYYTEKVAEGAEDYYSGEGEAEGQWLGDAAQDLGLEGKVEPAQLTAMLSGDNPATGEPLGLRAVGGSGAVPGFDLTFSAPKSVSLVWGLGGPEVAAEVRAAHQLSVEAALGYLQREACWTRRGAGGSEFVQGSGFLAAGYLHRSSRNGDPQLHTHVLIANATKGSDGRWTRLYHPAIYEHAKTASYLYEANLRHELSLRLGVKWQEVRKGIAEIEGFEDRWLREFSTRRAEILEAAGPDASAKARQIATLTTRHVKEREAAPEAMRERWAERAIELGLERRALAATLGRDVQLTTQLSLDRLDRQVTAHASHFDRRDVVQAVADLLPSGAPATDVENVADAFLASDLIVHVAESAKGERFTTQRIWELEREAIETAQRMADEVRGLAGDLAAARVIKDRSTMTADQGEMVRRLLADGEGIVVVIGEAGTGKTFATVASAEGWAQAGYELRAVAPTWRAANVLREEGLEATTVASLLVRLDRVARVEGSTGLLDSHTVLLVDEAAMVGSADLASLIHHADAAEAKLVLIGDPQQLGSIDAGGLFSAIADRTQPVELHEVIRHNHELDREAAKRIREGDGGEALNLYRDAERVTIAPDSESRREAMARDWWRSHDQGDDAFMVAKRNVEVERLNATARELMKAERRLGKEELRVGEGSFAVGDLVITRVNDSARDIYNRERWRVAEVDAARERMTLEGIDQARRVEIGREYLSRSALGDEVPALQHAYAVTTYCAQGTTVDRAFVMADPSMDKQELYVATSRSREETYLYATPEIEAERSEYAPASVEDVGALGHLAQAAERDRAQTAAHDEALRDELRKLPTGELLAREQDLASAARTEARAAERYEGLQERLETNRADYEKARQRRQEVEALSRRERKRELDRALGDEGFHQAKANMTEAKAQEIEHPGQEARREHEVARQVRIEREAQEVLATRLSPPSYISRELGQRPTESSKAREWDHGALGIERYRREYGVTDRNSALGKQPQTGFQRAAHEAAERRLRQAQQRLHLHQQLKRTMERVREAGRGLGLSR